jgi:hypothetical protein
MKNTIKLFGIIALVAVLGFTMVACKDEEAKDAFTVEDTVGRLTITGLGSLTGSKNVYAGGQVGLDILFAAKELDAKEGTFTYAPVEANGEAALRVWKVNSAFDAFSNYNETKTGVTINVFQHNGPKNAAGNNLPIGTVTVSFTNGVGTGAFTATP